MSKVRELLFTGEGDGFMCGGQTNIHLYVEGDGETPSINLTAQDIVDAVEAGKLKNRHDELWDDDEAKKEALSDTSRNLFKIADNKKLDKPTA